MNNLIPSSFHRLLRAGLAAFFFVALAPCTRAASYYVATTGADTNPGTETLPWRTVQKAANTLKPGDTAYVHKGTYAKVTVNVSGSAAGGYVTFRNYQGETPILDATGVTPPDADTGLFLLANRSYVVIEGFILRNYKTANIALVPTGILLDGACQHVQIRDCHIHDIVNTGGNPANSGNAFGIAVYGSSATPTTDIIIDGNDVHDLQTGSSESVTINGNVTNFQVTNNTVHDNNNIGIDFIGFEGTCPDPTQDQARDGVCTGNTVWNISSQGNQAYPDGDYSADGLYCDGATGVTLQHNRVQDCDIGLELASEHAGKFTSAIKALGNTFITNRQAGLLLGGYAETGTGGTAGCTISGNTFDGDDTLQEGNGEVQIRYRTSNCVVSHNTFGGGAENLLVTVPVPASDNVNNTLDGNSYYAPAGANATSWSWNNVSVTGFAAWKKVSGQDANSVFSSQPPNVNAVSPALRAPRPDESVD